MMFNRKNILTFLFLAAIIAGIFWYIAARVYSLDGNKIKAVNINGKTFYAEIVSSPEKMQKGLGKRNGLCQSCAMLFQFSEPGKRSFWMKDMRFPLDILWILNGKVVHIEKNVPKAFLETLTPQVAANQVLEINAGLSDKLGIKEGNKVDF
jgi:uncharacterized protein